MNRVMGLLFQFLFIEQSIKKLSVMTELFIKRGL